MAENEAEQHPLLCNESIDLEAVAPLKLKAQALSQQPRIVPNNDSDAVDLLQQMLHDQYKFGVVPSFMEAVQQTTTVWMRQECVDWAYGFAREHRLSHETLAVGIMNFDRVLSKVSVSRLWIQLVAAVSMWIAAKMHEPRPFSILDLKAAVDFAKLSEIRIIEKTVLNVLEWRLCVITPHSFLHAFFYTFPLESAELQPQVVQSAVQFADLGICVYQFVDNLPSTTAMAAALCALRLHRVAPESWVSVVCGTLAIDMESARAVAAEMFQVYQQLQDAGQMGPYDELHMRRQQEELQRQLQNERMQLQQDREMQCSSSYSVPCSQECANHDCCQQPRSYPHHLQQQHDYDDSHYPQQQQPSQFNQQQPLPQQQRSVDQQDMASHFINNVEQAVDGVNAVHLVDQDDDLEQPEAKRRRLDPIACAG